MRSDRGCQRRGPAERKRSEGCQSFRRRPRAPGDGSHFSRAAKWDRRSDLVAWSATTHRADGSAAPASGTAGAPPVTAAPPPVTAASPLRPPEIAKVAGSNGTLPRAPPSLRRLARDLGVDLAKVVPTGPRGRMTRADIDCYVKGALAVQREPTTAAADCGLKLLPWPEVDFPKFGTIAGRFVAVKRRQGSFDTN
jgi:pyruvate/2-oxoglutarate dehydrogenase complex dihydrolipoamide acyltransferase (E2) component